MLLPTKSKVVIFGFGLAFLLYYIFFIQPAPVLFFPVPYTSANFRATGRWEPSIPVPLVPVAAAVLAGTGRFSVGSRQSRLIWELKPDRLRPLRPEVRVSEQQNSV